MRNFSTFFAVAFLTFSLTSIAVAESGKGKMGDLGRSFKADGLERSLDRELDFKQRRKEIDNPHAATLNKQFTRELKRLKEELTAGAIDRTEFDKRAAELKVDFLKDLDSADRDDTEM